MPRLAPEIFRDITLRYHRSLLRGQDWAALVRDRARAALVCREWNDIFTPLLYEIILFPKGNLSATASFVQTIRDHPERLLYIRVLCIPRLEAECLSRNYHHLLSAFSMARNANVLCVEMLPHFRRRLPTGGKSQGIHLYIGAAVSDYARLLSEFGWTRGCLASLHAPWKDYDETLPLGELFDDPSTDLIALTMPDGETFDNTNLEECRPKFVSMTDACGNGRGDIAAWPEIIKMKMENYLFFPRGSRAYDENLLGPPSLVLWYNVNWDERGIDMQDRETEISRFNWRAAALIIRCTGRHKALLKWALETFHSEGKLWRFGQVKIL